MKNVENISTGYTGAPRGRKNCCDIGECRRRKHNTPSGAGYEFCRSVHAEMNAIISAARRNMIGATLYLVGVDKRTDEYKENIENDDTLGISKRKRTSYKTLSLFFLYEKNKKVKQKYLTNELKYCKV